VGLVPDAWLLDEAGPRADEGRFTSAEDARTAYVDVLTARMAARQQSLSPLERLRRDAAGARSAG